MPKRSSDSNILFEMLKSFTTLAHTLNLSAAMRTLGITRQTLRRHIDVLEEARGEKLFELIDRQYKLTEVGRRSLATAEYILTIGNAWYQGQVETSHGLQYIAVKPDSDNPEHPVFYSQQHRLDKVWQVGTSLMQKGLTSWVEAKGEIEHDAFLAIRPYWIIFRKLDNHWVCAEIGEKSALATWFGWSWTKSAIGNTLNHTPFGPDRGDYISRAYLDVYETGCPRFDHQYRHVPRRKDGPPVPISFQRLLLSCRFPDGSFSLVTLSDRTHNLDIYGLDPINLAMMPEELVMEPELSGGTSIKT